MNIGSVLYSVYGGFQESVYMLKLIIMYAEKMNTARCNLKCKKNYKFNNHNFICLLYLNKAEKIRYSKKNFFFFS